MQVAELPLGLKLAWCEGASPPDNSCSPANKGTGEKVKSNIAIEAVKAAIESAKQTAYPGQAEELASLQESLDLLNATPPDLQKEYSGVKEHIDKLVQEGEGKLIDTEAAGWTEITPDAQMNAYEIYYTDPDIYEAAYAAAEEDLMGNVESDTEALLNESKFTADTLMEKAGEYGIDEHSIDVAALDSGYIDSSKLVFTDGAHGGEAEDRWTEIEADFKAFHQDQ